MVLKIELADNEVTKPVYGSEGAACFDIASNENVNIDPGQTLVVNTGLKMEVPKGYEVVIRPRSGMSAKSGIRVANSPGTIDSDYRGWVGVILHNTGEEKVIIRKGDRIAQAKLQKAEQVQFIYGRIDTLTERGAGGFGSTGN